MLSIAAATTAVPDSAFTFAAESGGGEEREEEEDEEEVNGGIGEADSTQTRKAKAQRKKDKKSQKDSDRVKRKEEIQATAGPSMRQVELEAINRMLHSRGLRVKEVLSDGNCLFRYVKRGVCII